jgi:S-DNA-T family DNA segregation ATPase FtsK/SpoIIIE
MAKGKKKRANAVVHWKWEPSPEVERGITAVIMLALGVLGVLAYFNVAGVVGQYLDRGLDWAFGVDRVLAPLALAGGGIALLARGKVRVTSLVGAFLFFLSANALIHLIASTATLRAGGALGTFLAIPLVSALSLPGALVILCALLIAGFILTFDSSLKSFSDIGGFVAGLFHRRASSGMVAQPAMVDEEDADEEEAPVEEPEEEEAPIAEGERTPAPALIAAPPLRKKRRRIEIPLDLLEQKSGKPNAGDIRANQEVIRRTLEHFGIPVEMGEVSVGPTVTQYTLKPAEGVKLSKIINLSNDLALAMAAHPIRIEAPIPGKSLVGIEVPNQTVAMVKLREVLEAPEFRQSAGKLAFALGKDVAGAPWVGDIARMPHLLVAGATGSGKTVCLNTLIVSLLFANGPDDLKFIMIDPKRVELPCYNGIPHLLTPAITEIPKIVNSLKWCIGEMERRFDLLAHAGNRDIASYNKALKGGDTMTLPYIVVVIDELADLMTTSAQEVEGSIVRLAQMARAVGIHLVVATQRPSVDVITGLIKANITSRIAFAVATSTDSRTIIDTSGAEKLLGRGDMLYTTAELTKPKRIQGCYVSDEEIKRVVSYLKEHAEGEPEYREDVTEKRKAMGPSGESYDDSEDDLLPEARELVVAAGKASASLLQRRLKVGYARAARLLDLMESQGVIGPGDGAKPREILVKRSAAPRGDDESAGSSTVFADDFGNIEESSEEIASGSDEESSGEEEGEVKEEAPAGTEEEES